MSEVGTIALAAVLASLPCAQAFAFSLGEPPAASSAQEKQNGQAPDAPASSIPAPGPLIDKSGSAASDANPSATPLPKTVDFIFDMQKLPEPVQKLRASIVEAAASGNLERLRPLLVSGTNKTQVTADDPGEDPITALHDLSGDPDGVEILSILLDILSTGVAHINAGSPDEAYVWPYFAEKDIKTLTPPEKVDLMRIVTAGDYSDMLEVGQYNFYQVGITPDGKWKFFTAGGD